MERTYVEEDTSIEIVGAPRAKKTLPGGVEMAWGEVILTRSFSGYFTHSLLPGRRCRHCRKEYDETINTCPDCGRATETFFRYSKPERHDFPEPHRQNGFELVLKTVACWLTAPAALETRLEGASPCKLPGDKNGVLRWLQQPAALDRLPLRVRLSEGEMTAIEAYQRAASEALAGQRPSRREAQLFPAIYAQCLMHALRQACPEPRALELFQALTAYPVTDNLTHVCRQCQTSVLFQALHTLEHTVLMRYPSLALGDQADLGTYTTLGHYQTGAPTIFWFDDYEGGMGAAEKVYDKILPLIEAGAGAVADCACRSLDGCPRCTQIGHCDSGNQQLSKPALLALAGLLLGRRIRRPASMPTATAPTAARNSTGLIPVTSSPARRAASAKKPRPGRLRGCALTPIKSCASSPACTHPCCTRPSKCAPARSARTCPRSARWH